MISSVFKLGPKKDEVSPIKKFFLCLILLPFIVRIFYGMLFPCRLDKSDVEKYLLASLKFRTWYIPHPTVVLRLFLFFSIILCLNYPYKYHISSFRSLLFHFFSNRSLSEVHISLSYTFLKVRFFFQYMSKLFILKVSLRLSIYFLSYYICCIL